MAADFDVRVGSLKAKSGDRQSDWYLISLSSEVGAGGVGHAGIEVAAAGAALPELGDEVAIELAGKQVFAGHVLGVKGTPDALVITAGDGLAKLARLEVEGAYADKSAGAIVKDVLEKAGLDAGTVEDGPKLKSCVLYRGPRAMRHLERLAEQSGFLLYADGAGKIHFAAPKSGGADHTFAYSSQVLRIELSREAPAFDGAIVWGEGAAGEKGAERAHWLATKLSSLRGAAAVDAAFEVQAGKDGELPLTVRDGTVRASADASDQAKARMTALASRKVRGFVEVVGEASVEPGALVKIDGIPEGHPVSGVASDEVLRVRRVRHALSARRGFVTRLEL